jgi:SAM-dependent methyltransferase
MVTLRERVRANFAEPSVREVVDRWSQNVDARCTDLLTGRDANYSRLVACFTHLVSEQVGECGGFGFDFGSGIGMGTDALRALGLSVAGVEPSAPSVSRARELFGGEFIVATAEQFADQYFGPLADFGCALMVAHCTPEIDGFLAAVSSVLTPGGTFIVTIPDPAVHLQKPRFEHYAKHFDYHVESTWELPFSPSRCPKHPSDVLYFHRPIETYLRAFAANEFEDVVLTRPECASRPSLSDTLSFVARRSQRTQEADGERACSIRTTSRAGLRGQPQP